VTRSASPATGDIASLLLPLNGVPSETAALSLGLTLARRFSAHLQVLHVATDGRDVAPLAGEGLSGAMVEEMMTAAERDSDRRIVSARALLETALDADAATAGGVRLAVRGPGAPQAQHQAGVTFRSVKGREHEVVAHAARLSDLILVPHPDAVDEALSSSEALHAVLFDSGRPAIIAPKTAPSEIGRRICVAWNGTAESASAVFSVLGWLHQADSVQVLHSPDYQRRGPAAADLVGYLAMHGIEAGMTSFRAEGGEVGAALLAAADSFGADMLAMGAYSHSRLRQLFLGGVTRHVIAKATLPVLMAR
jgi:nucleotide-binding universal stress UspA family protein